MSGSSLACGYAYVEVLVAVIILGICLAPMVSALVSATRHQANQQNFGELSQRALERMDEVLAAEFAAVDAAALASGAATVPSSYSDADGSPGRRLVFLARYDQDNADGDNSVLTGGDPGLLWIRVTVENSELDYQTLRARL